MLRCTALAYLAATAPAVTLALKSPACVAHTVSHDHVRQRASVLRTPSALRARSRKLFAQYSAQDQLPAGWSSSFDQASQSTYYVNEMTGGSQWEPPRAAAAQVVWRVVPTAGVCNVVFNVGNDQQQVLGRSHMAEQSPYVSRKQCIVEVAADGTASLVSIGKPLTLHKPPSVSFWCGLKKSRPLGDDIGYDEKHVLADGEQISLDMREPEAAIFTIMRQEQQGGEMGGGYDAQHYSDDGNWMWNGTEWIPAR